MPDEPSKMKRVIAVKALSPEFRKNCEAWYARLPIDQRSAVETWLVKNPLPTTWKTNAPLSDRAVYMYCTGPAEIDPWVLCETPAEEVTTEWIESRKPLVEMMPDGSARSLFRASELREVANA